MTPLGGRWIILWLVAQCYPGVGVWRDRKEQMDPITGMAELWGSLDLAGILKSSACDFMSLKQFLLDNMGPGFSEGRSLQCLHEEFNLQLHGLEQSLLVYLEIYLQHLPEEFCLQLLELGAVLTGEHGDLAPVKSSLCNVTLLRSLVWLKMTLLHVQIYVWHTWQVLVALVGLQGRFSIGIGSMVVWSAKVKIII